MRIRSFRRSHKFGKQRSEIGLRYVGAPAERRERRLEIVRQRLRRRRPDEAHAHGRQTVDISRNRLACAFQNAWRAKLLRQRETNCFVRPAKRRELLNERNSDVGFDLIVGTQSRKHSSDVVAFFRGASLTVDAVQRDERGC